MKKTLLFCISLFTNLSFSFGDFLKNLISKRNMPFVSDLKFSKIYIRTFIIFVLALNSTISNAQCGANAGTVNSNTDKICVGATESFYSTGWGGGTWSSSNPAVLQVSPNGQNANAVGKAPGTAYVIYTLTQSGCSDKTSQKLVTVFADLGATGEITGVSPQCQGNTGQVYSIPPVANAKTYVWTVPSGWTITSGANTNSITVTVGSSQDNLTVEVSNDCKTNAKKYKYVNVTGNKTATPTITATGSTTFCQGGSVVLTSSLEDNYLWSNGQTTRSITVTTAGNYSVTTTKGGYYCPSNASNNIAVTVNSGSTPTFTTAPSGTVCPNTNVTYTTESGKSNYVWSIPGTLGTDYTVISGSTSATSNSVVLQWKTAGSKTVTVNYSNGCSTTSAATNTVTVANNTVSTASSSPQVCINNAITAITHTVSGVTSINSSANLPTGVSAALSADKSTVTISGTPSQSGVFDYNITLVTGCGNIAATGRITVNAASVGGTASSSQSICSGNQPDNITLTGNTGTIQWQVSSDNNAFTNINGATSATLTSAQMGNLNATRYYKALVTNGGCASAYSTVATVTIAVIDRGRTKGGTHICPGNTNPTLKLYALSGDLDYPDASKVLRWEYSDDFNNATYTAIPGTANLTTYTPTETLTAFRTYRAVIKSGNCPIEYAIETRIDVDAPTAITSQSTATQSQCIGNSFSPISVTATGTGTLTYQWYSNNSNSNTGGTSLNTANGARTNTYTPQSSVIGTVYYYCIVTGRCGTATSAVSGAFITNPKPVTPTASVTAQPTCGVNTGTITFSAPTPATGITYSIDGTTYSNTSGVFSGVAVGTYNLSTKNSSGCVSATISVTVNAPSNKTWTGATSTSWNTAANWSPNGVPTASDCVVIPDLTNITNKPAISGTNASSNAYNLTVNNKASLVVESTNTLTIENAITVEANGSLVFENNSSLLQTNTANNINTGKITYKRTSEQIRLADFVYWSTPVSPQRLIDVSPLSPQDKFYSFSGDNWVSNNVNNNMIVGRGYIIRAPNNFSTTEKADYTASFIGVPNNGTFSGQTLAAGKFYLVGNPYPSGMDADKFIANNPFLEGTLYFWTHNTPVTLAGAYRYSSTDYASYNITGGVGGQPAISGSKSGSNNSKPTGKIGAGQSFFASAATPGTVTFNNGMRLGGTSNSQFFKSATAKSGEVEKHRVWLNMTNEEGAFKQMLVGYVEGASDDYESRYDGVSFDANPYVDFYSVANGNNYVIQARALPFRDSDQVPLGYRTTIAGNFTISIDEVDGDLTNQNIYLEDKKTGEIHNLKSSDYTFTTEKGTFTDRLVLRYTNKTLGTGDFENVENGVLVSVKNKAIQIVSSQENISQIAIYDITGKQLYNKNKVGTTELQVSNLSSGNQILIAKVTLENGYVMSKKIIFN